MDSLNNASLKLGSDAWLELQAFKTRQLNRREKLNRHKTLHKDLINGIACLNSSQPFQHHASTSSSTTLAASTSLASTSSHLIANQSQLSAGDSHQALHLPIITTNHRKHAKSSTSEQTTIVRRENDNNWTSSNLNAHNDTLHKTSTSNPKPIENNNLELVECLLLLKLFDVALKLPIDSRSLQRSICRIKGLETTSQSIIENLLQKFAHQELITIDEPLVINRNKQQRQQPADYDDESCIYVTSADHTKLVEFDKSYGSLDNIKALLIESKANEEPCDDLEFCVFGNYPSVPIQSVRTTLPKGDKCSTVDGAKQSLLNELDRQLLGTNSQQACGVKRKDDLESLLLLSSTKERESKKLGEELLELLSKPTAKERNLLESFRSADGYQVQEFCPKGTKGECRRNNRGSGPCEKLHFKKIIAKHTEESLGDCSFLNTCFHMDSCKYVHYEVDYDDTPSHNNNNSDQHQFKRPHPMEHPMGQNKNKHVVPNDNQSSSDSQAMEQNITSKSSAQNSICLPGPAGTVAKYTLSAEEQAIIDAKNRKRFKTVLYPPQWIQCDLRFFDMSLLGKFSVVMADPPWDIHMELPYGTMSDDEMRTLNIPTLQDDGVIFLWVTGRAMELGRECLALWGYERCDEIIWVKTNQLQRIIRTGRTGHWLNHGKEHCLVGVKGNPKDINRGLDCDVIVAEVRATSHKPDEIYGIIERLSPGTRKIELFGRAHNVQPNWITLGNQLNGVRLIEPSLVSAFKKFDLQTSADHLA